ncbi:cytochrome P450 [Microbacterium sp. B24]|uniref:cytochrome P450 n=1 Tax=Microbacterium sp. B24 TaxID=95616 RepID=UPI00055A1D97|nr:cytochrome P450 [Microbacterium sp. B24]
MTIARILRPLIDDAPGLLLRGYGFAPHIWARVAPLARSAPLRLLGHEAVLVRGEEGVALFYDEARIARHGAMPALVQETLFGHGSVHSLDGAAHRHRKATFVDVAYEDAEVQRLLPLLEREWQGELDAWRSGGRRTAYDAAVAALGRAVMAWSGLGGTSAARTRWSHRLAQIVDGFGAPYSPAYARAVWHRWRSDRLAERLIMAVREGRSHPAAGTALHAWAWHRDGQGALLRPRTAGVELQNVLRPMIAVSRFVAFAAKELHDRPEWRERIAAECAARGSIIGGRYATAFAQEVRRTAPFVPVLPGRARSRVELDGTSIEAGGRVVLDILGTDTDAASWADADLFDPSRFVDLDDYEAIAAFVPHGGGDVRAGHRCPGEKLAIVGLAAAVAVLSDPSVTICGSGLRVNRRRLPTKPASGARVRAAGASCPLHRR